MATPAVDGERLWAKRSPFLIIQIAEETVDAPCG